MPITNVKELKDLLNQYDDNTEILFQVVTEDDWFIQSIKKVNEIETDEKHLVLELY